MKSFFSAAAILISLTLSGGAQAQLFEEETVTALNEQVETLRTQLANVNDFLETNRSKVAEQEFLIQNAPGLAQQIIDDLNTMIAAFDTESDYYASIQFAKKDIRAKIDQYRASQSEVQQKAAEKLREQLQKFEEIDTRRDALIGRALAATRSLDIQKEDLEALIIVKAYTELGNVFTQMLDEVENAVAEAEKMNEDLTKVIQPE